MAYRAKEVGPALMGTDGSRASMTVAAGHAAERQTVTDDIHARGDDRTRMGVGYTRRAIEARLARPA